MVIAPPLRGRQSVWMARSRAATCALAACAAVMPMALTHSSVLGADRALTVAGRHSPSCALKGDLVAYVEYGAAADGTLTQNLYVMSLDGRTTERLSTTSTVWDPCVSPDGRNIVCSAVRTVDGEQRAGLWLINVQSRVPTMLLPAPLKSAPFAPCYSPNGELVAYVRSEDDRATRAGLWVMSVLRKQTQLFALHETLSLSTASGLMWMPDNVTLRFVATGSGGTQEITSLWELNTRTGKMRQVLTFPLDEVISDAAQSPDGTRLAYIRTRGDKRELVVRDPHTPDGRVIAQPVAPPVLIPRPFESDLSFTGDSGAIVYVSGTELRLVDVVEGGRLASPAYATECAENLAEILHALERYSRGHEGNVPAPASDAPHPDAFFWVPLLRPLMDRPERLRCPSDSKGEGPTSYELAPGVAGQAWADLKAKRQVVLRDREAFHGGKRMVIYSDGRTELVE